MNLNASDWLSCSCAQQTCLWLAAVLNAAKHIVNANHGTHKYTRECQRQPRGLSGIYSMNRDWLVLEVLKKIEHRCDALMDLVHLLWLDQRSWLMLCTASVLVSYYTTHQIMCDVEPFSIICKWNSHTDQSKNNALLCLPNISIKHSVSVKRAFTLRIRCHPRNRLIYIRSVLQFFTKSFQNWMYCDKPTFNLK